MTKKKETQVKAGAPYYLYDPNFTETMVAGPLTLDEIDEEAKRYVREQYDLAPDEKINLIVLHPTHGLTLKNETTLSVTNLNK